MSSTTHTPTVLHTFNHCVTRLILLGSFLSAAIGIRAQEGTIFWFGFMQNYDGEDGLYTRVHITSRAETNGLIEVPGLAWSQAFISTPGTTTVVNLPTAVMNMGSEVIENNGVHVVSDLPISLVAMCGVEASADATAIMPLELLGQEYMVAAYPGLPNYDMYSEFTIASTMDSTMIEIIPSVSTLGGHPAGVPFTIILNAGNTYQVQASTESADLSGTRVRSFGSCNWFAVFAGSMCTDIPTLCYSCDLVWEQLMPTRTWGMDFMCAPFGASRAYTVRIMAHEDNTSVQLSDGQLIVLNSGQVHEIDHLVDALCISADRSVCVTQFIQGESCAGYLVGPSIGEPSMLWVPPLYERMDTVLVSGIEGDEFNYHYLNIVIDSADIGELKVNGTVVQDEAFLASASCSTYVACTWALLPGETYMITAPNGCQVFHYGSAFYPGPDNSYAHCLTHNPIDHIPVTAVICHDSGSLTLNAPSDFVDPYWYAIDAPNDTLATTEQYTFEASQDLQIVVADGQGGSCLQQPVSFIIEQLDTIQVFLSANDSTPCQGAGTVMLITNTTPDVPGLVFTWQPLDDLITWPEGLASITSAITECYQVHVESPYGCRTGQDSLCVQASPNRLLSVTANAACENCPCTDVALSGQVLLEVAKEDFEDDVMPFITQIGGTRDPVCGSLTGDALRMHVGNDRRITTMNFNTLGGGTLRFHLKIAEGVAPCDDADIGDDIRVEYSLNNGLFWNTISTLNQANYPDFEEVIIGIPMAAYSAQTMFRIRALGVSADEEDVWVVDDLRMVLYSTIGVSLQWNPSPIIWNDDALQTPAYPIENTTFTLEVTDTLSGCTMIASDAVLVQPVLDATLGFDQFECGQPAIFEVLAQSNLDPFVDYNWNTLGAVVEDSTLSTLTVHATDAIVFVVGVSPGGCLDRDTILLTGLLAPPIFDPIIQGGNVLYVPLGYTYQWLLNGDTIPGAVQNTVLVDQPGTYEVIITNVSGCSTPSTAVIIPETEGIEEEGAWPVQVAYNADQQSAFIASQIPIIQLHLFDATGKLIRTLRPDEHRSAHIDLIDLEPGLYLVQLDGYKVRSTARLVVPF